MKKLILIFVAAIAFSCSDGSNRSSESGREVETEDNYSTDPLESDRELESDSASTPGMERETDVDTTSSNYNNPNNP